LNSRASCTTPCATAVIPRRPAPRSVGRLHVILALVLAGFHPPARAAEPEEAVLRFGIDRGMFRDLNRNDAEVAIAAYTKTAGDEFGVKARVVVIEGIQSLLDALRKNEVDLVNIPAEWLPEIPGEYLEGPIFVSKVNDQVTEQFVLLVRDSGSIHRLEDLRGRSVIVSSDVRSTLIPVWLEVLFREEGLATPPSVFGTLSSTQKPSQAVLPVFFGKFDACVVARAVWDVMGELNPQVKKQLRAIAESPLVITGLAVFRKGTPQALKLQVLKLVDSSQGTPAFKQILTLFRISGVAAVPDSILDNTRQLMVKNQLRRPDERGGKRRTPRAPTDAGVPARP